jgi:hypothetical protein
MLTTYLRRLLLAGQRSLQNKRNWGDKSMHKKRILVLSLLLSLQGMVYAQVQSNATIEEVHRFSFGQPFNFTTHREGDADSGMGDMFFPKNGLCLINGTGYFSYFLYDEAWKNIGKLPSVFGGAFHLSSTRYIVLCNRSSSSHIWVYARNDLTKALYEIETKGTSFLDDSVTFLTGNMLFGLDIENNMPISWELGSAGKVIFRDEGETFQWLSLHGDQIGGYKYDNGPRFGPVGSFGYQLTQPILADVDFSQGKLLGILAMSTIDIWQNGGLIGTDSKGLIYAYIYLPWRPDRKFLAYDDAYCFVIIDPWQKKALFRSLKTGQHMGDAGLPRAVSPDGNVYFFDVDVPAKQFVLRRVVNTWWDELKLKSIFTGTVNDNRVRIRDKPNVQGQIIDYLYEDEVARVVDKTSNQELVSGVKAPWYKIVMPDGRQGWMFGAFLNVQQ